MIGSAKLYHSFPNVRQKASKLLKKVLVSVTFVNFWSTHLFDKHPDLDWHYVKI